MIITSQNFVLKLEEILKDNLPTERYNDGENIVLNMIRNWHSGQEKFTHHTSGSTGRPKKIEISRDKIEISAKSTLNFIDPNHEIRSSLLCLSPTNIGGAMVVYRGLIYDHDITIVEPTANINEVISEYVSFDLVSLVPMQFGSLKKDEISVFKNILIGGAPMPVSTRTFDTNVYSTYGMTETVSHIALRPLHKPVFQTTGDAEISLSSKQTLMIKGSITDHQWLETNDLAEIHSSTSFKWVGRADFIINSGGVKINPEMIETQLADQIKSHFIASSLPDSKLGNKLILLIEGKDQELDFSALDKYYRPKEVYFNQKIFKTSGDKIDRKKTQNYFESSL